MIRNARTFKTTLPSAEVFEKHLEQLPWSDLRPGELRRHAFVENPVTRKLLTRFPGGYAFVLRTDEKVIPPSIVTRLLDERMAEAAKQRGRDIHRIEKQQMREDLIFQLTKTALTRTKLTFAYYDEKRHYLVVDAAARSGTDPLVSKLVQAMEALTTETIHVSNLTRGLTAKLQAALTGEPGVFGTFDIGDAVKIARKGEGGAEVVSYTGVDVIGCHEVEDQLTRGFKVKELRLLLDGRGFRLCDDFALKGFSWPESQQAGLDEEAEGDDAALWEATAATELSWIGDIVDRLVELLRYEEPESESADEAEDMGLDLDDEL